MMPTRASLVLSLCIAVAACDGGETASTGAATGSISQALQKEMTEQQVSAVSARVPDRIVMSTCGTETPKPFACKVHVHDRAPRAGQNDRKLSVVFEKINGRWIVTQWF
jgi:hypothetical protein